MNNDILLLDDSLAQLNKQRELLLYHQRKSANAKDVYGCEVRVLVVMIQLQLLTAHTSSLPEILGEEVVLTLSTYGQVRRAKEIPTTPTKDAAKKRVKATGMR